MKDKSLEDILNRSVAEQIWAVEKIWANTSEQSENLTSDKEQLTIVKERLKLYKENPTKIKSWEEVKSDYLKKK